MLVRQDFKEMPPKPFLDQIMDPLMKVYCFLWEHKNNSNQIKFTWRELSLYYNKNNFKTNVRKLNLKGLLSYNELIDGISIELVSWDEMMNEE